MMIQAVDSEVLAWSYIPFLLAVLHIVAAWAFLRLRFEQLSKDERFRSTASRTAEVVGRPVADKYALSEAQTCWSEGHGRYKHCGLRENPFADADRPQFSLTPLDIPLPELTPSEKESLSHLEAKVSDITEAGVQRTDPCTLLRFLRARKGNVAKAELLLREAAAFREKHDVNSALTHWNLEAYEKCFAPWWLSGGFVGHGIKGEPVALERLGRCHFPKLAANLGEEILQKMDIVHCQRVISAVEEDAARRNVPIKPVTVVIDMEGFGRDQIQWGAVKLLGKLVHGRDLMLTEVAGNILVVRAPRAASIAWSMLKHVLDAGTAAKVQIASAAETPTLLRQHLDESVIPAFLGGRKIVHDDPECRTLLAPGGVVPQEAFDQMRELIAGKENMIKGALRVEDVARDKIGGCQGCFAFVPSLLRRTGPTR